MVRARHKVMAALLSVLMVAAMAGGCNDPKDPQTWIKRLRDPEHAAQAVRRLQEIGDPVAVEPLCALFKDYPSPSILQAIISFKDKRAVPTLIAALDFTEETYHNATRAARALAEFKATEAVPALIKALQKPIPIKSRANLAKQAAIETLSALGDKRAVPALIKVAEGRPENQDFYLNKRAIAALGHLGDPAAIPVLIRSLFMSSTLQGSSFREANVALVQLGQPSVAPLITAFLGQDEALNALGKELEFRPGVVHSKTAIVLGNLRAKRAVALLIKQLDVPELLKGEAVPGAGGMVEALGKIGDRRSFALLTKMASGESVEPALRLKACRALTMLGDQRAAPVLLQLAEKGYLPGGLWDLRVEAALAYGRLVTKGAAKGVKVLKGVLQDSKVKSLPAYQAVRRSFSGAVERAEVAVICGTKVGCYATKLEDPKATAAQREKAAIMIGMLPDGRQALGAMVKVLPLKDPAIRLFLLESAKRIGKADDAALVKTLQTLIAKDAKVRAKFQGADLATNDRIALAIVLRNT